MSDTTVVDPTRCPAHQGFIDGWSARSTCPACQSANLAVQQATPYGSGGHAIYGEHRGVYYPLISGCYARNVDGQHVPAALADAVRDGWVNVSASREGF